MSIFTKTGDNGDTSLFGGERVKKSSDIITAIGDVDELISALAIVEYEIRQKKFLFISKKVEQIKSELFTLESDLANPKKHDGLLNSFITSFDVKELEEDILEWEAELPKLTNFLLPAGEKAALYFFWVRAVCRRAERSVARANNEMKINPAIPKYLNRLGDWLFICFRLVNHRSSVDEKLWNRKN